MFRAADVHRGVDLGAYAQRCHRYELRLHDGGQGIAVLEQPGLRDRVAVAQAPDGRWVYADVRHYAPRGPDEPAERALLRLRECIDRSPSKGGVSEFAQRVEGLKRERVDLNLLVDVQRTRGYELARARVDRA